MIKVNNLEEMPESIGGVSAEERETIIRKDYLTQKADICTTDYVEYGKLIKKCHEYPDKYKAIGYDTCGGQAQTAYFECPIKLISYRCGKERVISDEVKAAATERLKAFMSNKRQNSSKKEGEEK